MSNNYTEDQLPDAHYFHPDAGKTTPDREVFALEEPSTWQEA